MDKSYPAKAPMVVRSIDLEKDIFRPRPDIGALMFLANSTRPDIAFAVNLLARQCCSNKMSLGRREANPQIPKWDKGLGFVL